MANLATMIPYAPDVAKGRTIIITGGASGLGAAMARRLASIGANITIADLNESLGNSLVKTLRTETVNANHHFVHCDVTSWESQLSLFESVISWSPSKTIHTVIANAGVPDVEDFTELPLDPLAPCPRPNLKTLDVNLTGLVYTSRLAMHYFRRNRDDEDKHLLLLGSMACFLDGPGNMGLYGTSKHGVLGFFRYLRLWPGSQVPEDFRVNLLCPYFADTPILPTIARVVMAGGVEMAKVEDVVSAAERLVCSKAKGRCLVVAPKGAGGIQELAQLDMKAIEPFSKRVVELMNSASAARKFVWWWTDMFKLFGIPFAITVLAALAAVTSFAWVSLVK